MRGFFPSSRGISSVFVRFTSMATYPFSPLNPGVDGARGKLIPDPHQPFLGFPIQMFDHAVPLEKGDAVQSQRFFADFFTTGMTVVSASPFISFSTRMTVTISVTPPLSPTYKGIRRR